MRLLTGALAMLLLAVTMPPSDAVGGVLVTGVGVGDTYLPDGQHFCGGHTFSVQAVYLPGGNGLLRVDYAPAQSCLLYNGGGMFIGNSHINPGATPPIAFVFDCAGSESMGMYCSGTTQLGQSLWSQVGPHTGPGSSVSIAFSDPELTLRGSFIAV